MLLKKEMSFFVHEVFVGENDLMRPTSILDMFQDIASIHADETELGFKKVFQMGYLWVVTNIEFNINRTPHFGEMLKVITWPHPKGKLEYTREYEIRDEADNIVVTGISSWFLIDKETHRLTRSNLEYDGEFYEYTNYPGYRRAKLNTEPASESICWTYNVEYTDLDHNEHMNNARYLDIIYNKHINMKLDRIKKVSISFVHEALLHEDIKMEYYKNTNNVDCYIGTTDSRSFEVLMEVDE